MSTRCDTISKKKLNSAEKKKLISNTYARGRITAQSSPVICHSGGTTGVAMMIIPATTTVHIKNVGQYRFITLGTS